MGWLSGQLHGVSGETPGRWAADSNSRLARVAFDQRHAARGDAGEERLAVGERVRLRARRRVEREMLATNVAFRATDHSHARRPDRIDLVTAHVCRAPFTRSGVNGTRRRRTLVAANTALAMAAGTGQAAGSPAPTDGWSRRSMSVISMASGTSLKRSSGYDCQSRLVTRRRSKRTSSFKVRLIVWTTLPSIWFRTPSGLTMSPQSWATNTRRTRIAPVRRSTSTSATMAA